MSSSPHTCEGDGEKSAGGSPGRWVGWQLGASFCPVVTSLDVNILGDLPSPRLGHHRAEAGVWTSPS